MKVNFEFNLPEEKEEFDIHSKAMNMTSVIIDFYNYLRNEIKYKDLTDQEFSKLKEVNERFISLLEENDINYI